MLHARALLLAGLGLGTALVAGCDRSIVAPRFGPPRAGVSSATDQQIAGFTGAAGTAAIMPGVGGRIDLAARPGYPVDCSLDVPADALDGPTVFQLTHESDGAGVTVHIAAHVTELDPNATALRDDPILLSLTYAAPDGAQDVTVEFSPPDGSDTVVAKVTLRAGRATVLGFRRGRSKYSVIFF